MKLHKEVIRCDSSLSIQEVAALIRDNQVRHVYVTEKDKLVGILGGIDINNKIIAEGKTYKDLKVKDIMNDVKFVKEDQKPEYAFAIMRNFNTFICPVVDKDERLLGYYKFAEVCDEIHDRLEGEANGSD